MRLGLAVSDLMTKLLKSRPLTQLRRAGRMLNLILVDVVLRRFEVHREFRVVRQCLVLGVVLVQIEIVVVRYVGVRFDGGYVPSGSGLPSGVEVQLRLRETGVRVRSIPRAKLLAQPLIQGSLTLKTTLKLSYLRVYRRHFRLSLCQG